VTSPSLAGAGVQLLEPGEAAAPQAAAQAGEAPPDAGSGTEGSEDSAVLGDGKNASKKLTARTLLQLILPDWPLIINACIFLLAAAIFQTLIPHYLSETIQSIISAQERGRLGPEVFRKPTQQLLVVALASAACSAVRGATFITIGARAAIRLRCKLFDSLLTQDIGFFDATKTGELTSRLTQDCQKVVDQVELNVNVFLRTLVQLVTTLCFMFFISVELTAVSFVAVPLIVAISKEYGAFMRNLSEKRQEKLAEANARAEEALSSMATVRYFAAEDMESNRFADKLREVYQLQLTYATAYLGYLTSAMFLPQGVACIALMHGGWLCIEGMRGSQLLAFVLYLQTLNDCFSSLADFYSNIVQALGSAARVFELIERKPEGRVKIPLGSKHVPTLRSSICALFRRLADSPTVRPGREGMRSASGHLEIKDAEFSYPTRPKQPVLKGLSIVCPPGKVVALVGPSGGGKSTVISLFERIYEVAKGSVTLDSEDVRYFDHHWYHEQVSIVGQEPTLFGRSVRENILYGLPSDHPAHATDGAGGPGELVERASKLANVHETILKFAQKYDTEVGERGVQLSGGQKQRLAIARALVRRPRVLLLDEATSALDSESERLVQQSIDNMIAQMDMTVVIVAHRLSTVRNANKIYVIKAGAVCEEGTHEELLTRPDGQYKQLVSQQLMDPSAAPPAAEPAPPEDAEVQSSGPGAGA